MDHRAEKAKSEFLGSAELLKSLGVKREREGEKGRERGSLITQGKFLSLYRTHTAKCLAFISCLASSVTFS